MLLFWKGTTTRHHRGIFAGLFSRWPECWPAGRRIRISTALIRPQPSSPSASPPSSRRRWGSSPIVASLLTQPKKVEQKETRTGRQMENIVLLPLRYLVTFCSLRAESQPLQPLQAASNRPNLYLFPSPIGRPFSRVTGHAGWCCTEDFIGHNDVVDRQGERNGSLNLPPVLHSRALTPAKSSPSRRNQTDVSNKKNIRRGLGHAALLVEHECPPQAPSVELVYPPGSNACGCGT